MALVKYSVKCNKNKIDNRTIVAIGWISSLIALGLVIIILVGLVSKNGLYQLYFIDIDYSSVTPTDVINAIIASPTTTSTAAYSTSTTATTTVDTSSVSTILQTYMATTFSYPNLRSHLWTFCYGVSDSSAATTTLYSTYSSSDTSLTTKGMTWCSTPSIKYALTGPNLIADLLKYAGASDDYATLVTSAYNQSPAVEGVRKYGIMIQATTTASLICYLVGAIALFSAFGFSLTAFRNIKYDKAAFWLGVGAACLITIATFLITITSSIYIKAINDTFGSTVNTTLGKALGVKAKSTVIAMVVVWIATVFSITFAGAWYYMCFFFDNMRG
ncbi:uncharacterized protein SAPINGB_P002321 [Magnusiomyces paraingens]|uniref:Uncharacterized protein n=1 Tax=Magnusiomyces paraingens TaxID=2606893 RepID=A0A5E8BD71_9ASCO|nr:uncharacterized protein SAPINGB_P002321 [Saprochaete ingens]VVT49543.1 unnamed protein product [Saprochaete ingens]